MKELFACSMPFVNRAGRLGIELDLVIENPDKCEDICKRIAKDMSLKIVFGAIPRLRIQIHNGKAMIWERKKGTLVPQEAKDQRMLHSFNSFMGNACASPTHENSFDAGIWENPQEVDIDGLILRLRNIYAIQFIHGKKFPRINDALQEFRAMLEAC